MDGKAAELFDLRTRCSSELTLVTGLHLASARFTDDHGTHPGLPVAGALRLAGACQLAGRYPIAVVFTHLAEFAAQLSNEWFQGGRTLDPYVLSFNGRAEDGRRLRVLLVSRDQAIRLEHVGAIFAELSEVVLPNSQRVNCTSPARGPVWLEREATLEFQTVRYEAADTALVPDGEALFQASPSGTYARRLSNSHSFRCLLATSHRRNFASNQAVIRNPALELAYPGIILLLPVLVGFADSVEETSVVVDETVATGIGLRPGEVIEVTPLPRSTAPLAQRALSFRHSLCRVHGSNTTDMEKPLARLPQEVFDIIGVDPGARVVIEAFSRTDGGVASVRRMVVRALVWRGQDWPVPKPGVPDILMETGSQDLPPVTLDLACQRELGVSRGSPVYVRPAIASLIAEEASIAITAVVIAALGAAVLGNMVIASAFLAIFLGLLAFQLWRRLR